MPINFRTVSSQQKPTSPSRRKTINHLENPHGLTLGSDAVRLTDVGTILHNAEKLVATLPDVDAARVLSVIESIDNGSYLVNAERVAEKIIEFEQSLTG